MGVCSKVTFGATAEVGLSMYYAVKTDAWKLGSTTNSACAVASAASAGGLLLCLVLMLWRKYQGQPVTHGLAPPVMLLAEGLYDQDQDMIDSAAVLLPVQSGAIVALWLPVSAIGATLVDYAVLAAVLYYSLALVCRRKLTNGDSTISTIDRNAERLQSWCLLPLILLVLETVLAFSEDLIGGSCLLAVDGYVLFLTLNWLKGFAVRLVLAPPTVFFHLIGRQTGAERVKAGAKGWFMGHFCAVYLHLAFGSAISANGYTTNMEDVFSAFCFHGFLCVVLGMFWFGVPGVRGLGLFEWAVRSMRGLVAMMSDWCAICFLFCYFYGFSLTFVMNSVMYT